MNILIFGGTGFVGINIASALLARGHAVTLFDRGALPRAAAQVFAERRADDVVEGDITDSHAVETTIARGFDAIILGAAITAGPAREAADPQSILHVNLLAQVPILMAAHRHRVGRVINLSSGSAYGAAAFRHALLDEEVAVRAGLALRHHQICLRESRGAPRRSVAGRYHLRSAERGVRAVGALDGRARYAEPSDANRRSFAAETRGGAAASRGPRLDLRCRRCRCRRRCWSRRQSPGTASTTYRPEMSGRRCNGGNVSPTSIRASSAVWRSRVKRQRSICIVDADRAPLSIARMAEEFGWRARFGCADSAADLNEWWMRHGEGM